MGQGRWVAAIAVALALGLAVPDRSYAQLNTSPTPTVEPTHYVRASDGVLLAVNVRLPDRYAPGRRYSSIFAMDGYEGASGRPAAPGAEPGDDEALSRKFTHQFNRDYVTVHVSMRGTGCSGGRFELFSPRSDRDGKEVIEWMARQPWSDGRVGIAGHSYSGITALRVAATRPAPAVALMAGGLVADAYRDVVNLGGVPNRGFPVVWPTAYRASPDAQGKVGGVRELDPTCARNVAEHDASDIALKPITMMEPFDGPAWGFGNLVGLARRIRVPTHVSQAFQDHNTGPRAGAVVFEALRVPKRLLMHTGVHIAAGPRPLPRERDADQLAWFDHWVGKRRYGRFRGARSAVSVVTLYEPGSARRDAVKHSRAWPPEDTVFADYHLRAGGALTPERPAGHEPADTYVAGVQRAGRPEDLTAVAGDDLVAYRTPPFKQTRALNGPIVARLWIRSELSDFDLFATLMDEAPDGTREVIQFGLLRASHRLTDPARGAYATRSRRTVEYRPYRPHDAGSVRPVSAGTATRYVVEVFPVGRILRPGHRLVLKLTTPPARHNLYVHPPNPAGAGHNHVLHDRAHPSSITLPFVGLGSRASVYGGRLRKSEARPARTRTRAPVRAAR